MGEPPSPQVEADRRLLQFQTYEDYLDSLVTPQDVCYLKNSVVARTLAELGYRSSGETLSRKQFEHRLAAVIAYLYPTFKPFELASRGLIVQDPLQKELALRERPNRVGILATIIYIRDFTRTGCEISGYIDYGDRLKNEDWKPYFKQGKRFWPRQTDLGFYNWRTGKITTNHSMNYKVWVDPAKGLLFQNRFDRKIVCVDPMMTSPGNNTKRTRVVSDDYEHTVLYDHIVMQRI